MLPSHWIDLNSASSLIFIGSVIVTLVGAFNRHRIVKHARRIATAFRSTVHLVTENERLSEDLADSEQRNVEWASAFENLDRLRSAIILQLESLESQIKDVRARLTAKDDIIGLLHSDRDHLLTSYRLLVGQLHDAGLAPEYPSPVLRSIIAIPTAIPEDTLQQ